MVVRDPAPLPGPPPHRPRRRRWATPVVFVLGLLATFAGYQAISYSQREQAQAHFNAAAGAMVSALQLRLSQCDLALRSVGHFYAASEAVSPSEFRRFTEPLLRSTPGAVAFYQVSRDGNRLVIELRARADDRPSLPLRYDLSAHPELLQAMAQAERRRDLASTPPLPSGPAQAMVLAFLPLPAANSVGASPRALVLQMDPESLVHQINAASHNVQLSLEHVPALDPDRAASDRRERSWDVALGESPWRATVVAKAASSNARSAWLPAMALLSGLLITLLATAYLRLVEVRLASEKRSARMLGDANRALRAEIEDRASAERALVASESRYRGLADSVFGGVLLLDGERVRATNRALHDTLGYEESELVGTEWLDLVPEEAREAARDALAQHDGRLVETSMRRKGGGTIPVELCSKALTDEPGDRSLLTVRDINDRLRRGEEQAQLQRLESLGVMAGGLAHDFNNLLMSILGNLDLASLCLDEGSEAAAHVAEAETATLRAREITQRLLTFSKGGSPARKPMDMANTVRQAVRLAAAGSNCLIEVDCSPELWAADGDPGQLSQVIHNLVLNAIQSMPDGGRVQVRCDNEMISTPSSTIGAGRYVRVRVRDEGSGIPQEDLAHVFDPYFSTKAGGHGLGLPASHSIVRSHHGALHVTATSSAGTEFTLWIPASDKPCVPSERPEPASKRTWSGRVLVMDDEPSVRRVLVKMLGRVGLEATTAENGEQALEALKATASGAFSLAILDLTVQGGMGGLKALEELRKIDATLPAIVSSGYSDDAAIGDHLKLGFDGILQKPYTQADLLELLEQVLKARRPRGGGDRPPSASKARTLKADK